MATKQRSGVKRRVESRHVLGVDGYVATYYPDGVRLRPVRARKAEAEVYVSWDQIYTRALTRRVPPIEKRAHDKARRQSR